MRSGIDQDGVVNLPMPPDLPEIGRLVRYQTKDDRMRLGQWQVGRVESLFLACDAEVVRLDTGRTFFPGLGDLWDYIDAY